MGWRECENFAPDFLRFWPMSVLASPLFQNPMATQQQGTQQEQIDKAKVLIEALPYMQGIPGADLSDQGRWQCDGGSGARRESNARYRLHGSDRN